jgi:hypothetical protein
VLEAARSHDFSPGLLAMPSVRPDEPLTAGLAEPAQPMPPRGQVADLLERLAAVAPDPVLASAANEARARGL